MCTMRGLNRQQGSVIAATTISLLTVTVFAISRNQGPESAISHYHESLASFGDASALRKAMAGSSQSTNLRLTTVQSPDLPQTQSFHFEIYRLLRESRSIRIGHVQRLGRVALVDVAYSSAFGVMTVRYALQKGQAGWSIDTAETLRRTQSLMGLN